MLRDRSSLYTNLLPKKVRHVGALANYPKYWHAKYCGEAEFLPGVSSAKLAFDHRI